MSSDVARAAAAVSLDAIAAADHERARHCVLDWICAAVAGAQEPVARIVQAVVRAEGGAPLATVLGTDDRCGPQQAALANGVAAHALELDDVARWMVGHPAAPICSATFALAQARGLPGRDALAAIHAGYDAACWIGVALGPGHGRAGWHATGTVGTFGAAAACARLIGLDATAADRALALAATQAAGLQTGIGTMAKSLHAGRAAAAGVLAAVLAEGGVSAPGSPIERFAQTHTSTYDPERPRREIGAARGIRSVVFKQYACCGLANPAVAGLVALVREHAFGVEAVSHAEIGVPAHWLGICAIPDPRTAAEARFSLRFAAAAALAGRVHGVGAFTEEGVRDPGLRALAERVTVRSHGRADQATDLELTLCGGRRLEARREPDEPARDADLPAQRQRLIERFAAIAGPLLGETACGRVVAAIDSLEDGLAVGELLELTRPAVRAAG